MTTTAAWLVCLAAVITLSTGARAADELNALALSSGQKKHLAVIVPAYRGDLQRAVSSLERWPTVCSTLTQANVDLVLYYAERDEDVQEVDEAAEKISESAGRCFARTRTVFASLEDQDDFYPKGPSVQFYKMFLDDDVRAHLAAYDALAIMEWDVLVAADNSFEELYKAAFAGGDDFWVKGSNLGGTNFHTTAKEHEMWHVLGHINGNAIYNNNDPAFVEYVEYTRARWQYEHPYDVALWLTISDFPYSWPLWQRYSSKFVTTNLISSVGGEHVDRSSVSDAVAGHTLFIHGSRVDEGNIASRKAVMEETNKRRPYSATDSKRKRDRKRGRRLRAPVPDGSDVETQRLPIGTLELPGDNVNRLSALDASEADKADGEIANNPNISRRLQKWRENERWKTLEKWRLLDKWKFDGIEFPEPPGQEVCLDECERLYSNGVTGRICDDTCATREFGFSGCRTKGGIFGTLCRLCYVDPDLALEADDIENNERAIMCDTGLPVTVYNRRLTTEDPKSALSIGHSLQKTKRRLDEASASVVVPDPENSSYGNTEVATTEIDNLFAELSRQPFTEDITRGEICAFIAGREDEAATWEITVRSILQFVPGMRVAIAVEGDPQVYRRTVGNFPGVIVRTTSNAFLAGLNADKHCGPGTRLIFYVEGDSILSRTFTAKDTHSPDGELLVVYSEPRTRDAVELTTLSSSVLGFRPPSFTHGADLILPVEANAALRDLMLSKLGKESAVPEDATSLLESMGEFSKIAAVPQILAALEYSRKASGVWFFNPQAWVAEHLFKPASIWEIPLVKPRFTCALPANARLPNPTKVLNENLDLFSRGGKCESGLIAVDASR